MAPMPSAKVITAATENPGDLKGSQPVTKILK